MIFEDYLERITSVLDKIKETQKGKILSAAQMVSETIKRDGIIYIFAH